MNEQLVIIGASGHGKVVADIAVHSGKYREILFLDDNEKITKVLEYQVVGRIKDYVKYTLTSDFAVAIGNASIREYWIRKLHAEGLFLPALFHPSSSVGLNVQVGEGTVVMAGAVINPDTVIGMGCIINTCASVDHDCVIRDYVHVSVGTHLAGNVEVGESTWIGAGATVSNNIKICEKCMVGAGAVVVNNINQQGTYIGIPAHLMKK